MSHLQRAQAVSLRRWNIAAGLLHLASFFAALGVSIAYNDRSYQTELSTDFNGVLRSLGMYRVVWVDLPFPLITAIFHLAMSAPSNWRWYVVQKKTCFFFTSNLCSTGTPIWCSTRVATRRDGRNTASLHH